MTNTTRRPDPAQIAQRFSDARPQPGSSDDDAPDTHANPTDFGIRIARDGTWFYHGSPITRKPLVRLFSSVLRRESDGSYWLVTPVERGRIEVDDAPFTAVELFVDGVGAAQSLRFRTNVDDMVTVGPAHPIRVAHNARTGEPAPYVLVRAGLEALISRAVYYELVDLGVVREIGGHHVYGVWSEGAFFALGELEEAT